MADAESDAPLSSGGDDAGSAAQCADVAHSDLPGVALVLTSPGCHFSRAQLDAGATTSAELRITSAPGSITPFAKTAAPCAQPDNSGFVVAFTLSGAGGRYCPACDVGRCAPPTGSTEPAVGTYPYAFLWHGHAWMGPAGPVATETAAPPLAAGTYTLQVIAEGSHSGQPFEVSVSRDITID